MDGITMHTHEQLLGLAAGDLAKKPRLRVEAVGNGNKRRRYIALGHGNTRVNATH